MTIKTLLYEFLKCFWENNENPRCLLVTAPNGSGKTSTIRQLIKEFNYSEIYFSSLETNLIDSIKDMSCNIVSTYSVIDSFKANKARKQVMVIDDIDGIRLNEPTSFSALTKLIRKKRSKYNLLFLF